MDFHFEKNAEKQWPSWPSTLNSQACEKAQAGVLESQLLVNKEICNT